MLIFVLLLAAAAILRVQVIASIPNFFGPGDPGIYYAMGRATLHHGWPRMEFIHHFLTRPHAIVHAEDYYEPAFGYLLAPALALGGEKPAAAAAVSLLFGLAAVVLVWRLARRLGPTVALIAAALVTFEPWSIYYSGLIMKEATVTVVVLLFLEWLRRTLESESPSWRSGLLLGAGTVAAGLMQYELIPILGLTCIVVLAIHRRAALAGYLIGAGACLAVLLAVTWISIGVPISAKYAFALGQSLGDPDRIAPARDLAQTLGAVFPFAYLGWTLLSAWYPLLILLAALGITGDAVSRVERTLLLTFVAVYLYLHAVPHDLWCRDFIPLTAVLAAPAALGLSRSAAWRSRSWLAPLAWALAVFLCVVPAVLQALNAHAGATRQVPVMLVWSAAALAALVFAALRWLPAGRFRDRMRRAGPFAAAFGVAMNFWLLLPYPAIYLNLQFPNYEIDRAHRERVGAWMRDSIPPGPVLTARPEEISIYSGFPAVALPGLVREGTLERLVARYGVRYLLLEPGTLPDSLLRTLTLHPVGEKEGARLFAF